MSCLVEVGGRGLEKKERRRRSSLRSTKQREEERAFKWRCVCVIPPPLASVTGRALFSLFRIRSARSASCGCFRWLKFQSEWSRARRMREALKEKEKSKPPTAVCFFSFLPSVSTMEHQKASPYLQAVLRLARGHANEEGGASTRSWSSARGGASASA